MGKKNYGVEGKLAANKMLLDLVKQYEREYRATGEENVALENKLRQHGIETNFDVDIIYFTDRHTEGVLYSFEL